MEQDQPPQHQQRLFQYTCSFLVSFEEQTTVKEITQYTNSIFKIAKEASQDLLLRAAGECTAQYEDADFDPEHMGSSSKRWTRVTHTTHPMLAPTKEPCFLAVYGCPNQSDDGYTDVTELIQTKAWGGDGKDVATIKLRLIQDSDPEELSDTGEGDGTDYGDENLDDNTDDSEPE
jgi:hypothetical protein